MRKGPGTRSTDEDLERFERNCAALAICEPRSYICDNLDSVLLIALFRIPRHKSASHDGLGRPTSVRLSHGQA